MEIAGPARAGLRLAHHVMRRAVHGVAGVRPYDVRAGRAVDEVVRVQRDGNHRVAGAELCGWGDHVGSG